VRLDAGAELAEEHRRQARARRQHFELDDATLARSRKIFSKALSGGKHKTRDELYALLERASIRSGGQRGYHILWNAANQGLICLRCPRAGNEQTFALLDEWVAPTREKTREEAPGRAGAALHRQSRSGQLARLHLVVGPERRRWRAPAFEACQSRVARQSFRRPDLLGCRPISTCRSPTRM